MEPREELGGSRSSVSILLVDDQPDALLALEALLQGPGRELVRARSGQEALLRILEEDFALILLDVQMPGMDGYETAEAIRQRDRSSRTPIIFLTASRPGDVQTERGYAAGGVDYVFKPIDPLLLRSKVDVFVQLTRKNEEIRQLSQLEAESAFEVAETRARLLRELERKNQELASAAADHARRLGEASQRVRAPSHALMGAVDHLLEAGLTPELREQLEVIQACGEELLRAGDTLLEMSRTSQERAKQVEEEAESGQLGRDAVGADVEYPRLGAPLDSSLAQHLPLRILVVEDDAVCRTVVVALLQHLGYQPDAAPDGESAIEQATARPYDLILLDLHMPGMDGLEVTQELLRQLPPGQRPRIVAMTGSVLDEEQRRCLEGGMDEHLSKPITPERLVAVLTRTQVRA